MSTANDNASSPLPGDGVSKRKQGKHFMNAFAPSPDFLSEEAISSVGDTIVLLIGAGFPTPPKTL
jgi:hypothetical protein